MKLVKAPDQAGYVEKYVCLECIKEVSERSIRALKEVA
jgi:DNA-directed RNA polymerase subunit RPC12/RpoP